MTSNGLSSSSVFQPTVLIGFAQRVLEELAVPEQDALTSGRCLVDANLRGIDSHGIVRLPVYAKRIQAGVVKPTPSIGVQPSQGVVRTVDGDNGLGPIVGAYSMQLAIEVAQEHGVGVIATKNSNHFGPASFYVEKALAEGCIGIASSNAPPNMAPWGGKIRFLGTNPIAIGVPAGDHHDILFDMATSVVARGKIILAAQKSEPIPEGWAIDPEGHPTTDAEQGLMGSVLPFGGPKGSAISLLIDILCGVLSGAAYGRHLNTLEDLNSIQNVGHFFTALNVESLMPLAAFKSRVDDLLDQLKDTPLAPGYTEILAPGEPELRTKQQRLADGIAVSQDVIMQLQELGALVGVDLPVEV